MKTIPVSRLVALVAAFVKSKIKMDDCMISGELSNVKRVSGHYYFDLKDEKGQISCTMWQSYAARLPFKPEDGLKVLVHGSLNVYEKRGSLQLSADSMVLDGVGALFIELEERKKRLEAQGWFNPENKKEKPAWIDSIAIVTGAGTAALQDALKTIQARWPMLKIRLFETLVQGQNAPAQIVRQLEAADDSGADAVLLIRGGGSFEDLFCFNDESIVKTLAQMKTYTVTGIGHEIDTTLADLAADHRAVTPTAAAQWVTPDQREVAAQIRSMNQSMEQAVRRLFDQASSSFVLLSANPYLASPQRWADGRKERLLALNSQLSQKMMAYEKNYRSRLQSMTQQLDQAVNGVWQAHQKSYLNTSALLMVASPAGLQKLQAHRLAVMEASLKQEMQGCLQSQSRSLESLERLLNAVGPMQVLERGYAIVRKDGQPVSRAGQLEPSDLITIQFKDGQAISTIKEIQNERKE